MDQTALVDTIVKTPEYMIAAIGASGAIIGAVLATAVALLTVRMTNRHNRQQLQQQLEHESRERQRERLLNLRRDVYLPAAEAMSSIVSTLTGMLMSDGGEEGVNDRLRALGQALARVELIATAGTLTHLAAQQRAMFDTFLAAYKRRLPIMLRVGRIAAANDAREKAHAERMKYVDLLKQQLLSGAKDDPRWKTVRELEALARRKWVAAMKEWVRLRFEQEADRLAMARDLLDRLDAWGLASTRLSAAIRDELEAGHENAVLMRLASESAARGKDAVKEFIPMIEGAIADLRREIEEDETLRLEIDNKA